jgi:hypothetical protein
MAFVSYNLNSGSNVDKYDYILTDSEFGKVSIESVGGPIVGIAREYIKRDLPVGRNLALFVIYRTNNGLTRIKNICERMDAWCPKHIDNWNQYAEERDRALEKLLALK